MNSIKKILLFFELIVLLALPVLQLNILYVLLVLIITLGVKLLLKEKFADYGFFRPSLSLLFIAAVVGIVYGLLDNIYMEPLLTKITGAEVDLGDYENVKGNVGGYIGLLALGWIVGGLFEEYFFRGYLFHRIGQFISHPLLYRIIAIALTSIVFAFAHSYQGITGIVATFLFSIVMGILFFLFRKNVWCLILVHGFYDTVGITMIFLGY